MLSNSEGSIHYSSASLRRAEKCGWLVMALTLGRKQSLTRPYGPRGTAMSSSECSPSIWSTAI